MMTQGEGVEVHPGIVEVGGWEEEDLFVIDIEMTGYDMVDETKEREAESESLVAETMMVCNDAIICVIMFLYRTQRNIEKVVHGPDFFNPIQFQLVSAFGSQNDIF